MLPNDWPKIIAHVDMDAFFASIEQRDFPELRSKPVAITNGELGSCVITRSYEARAYGVKTGMRLKEARKLCPQIIQRASRPYVYSQVSTAIMEALENLTPDIEIFSVDEAFLEFSFCRKLYRSIDELGKLIQYIVKDVAGISCSVGISGDKTTAKFASKRNKPSGLCIIHPSDAEHTLSDIPVTDICGIANGIGRFLAQRDVYHCGDMKKIPISVLGKRFGHIGRRIWLMCQGKDPAPLVKTIADPKSVGHGKVMPPNTNDKTTILFFLSHMANKVGHRLRRHQLQARKFFIGLRTRDDWIATKAKFAQPINDGEQIFKMARMLVENKWQNEGIFQCQITALDPQPENLQCDLFITPEKSRQRINQIVDQIQERYGSNAITNGTRITDLAMPDVIAPAWRPQGHRSNIRQTKK